MQPNNTFFIETTAEGFYRAWMDFTAPYHRLTSREKEVAARILSYYFKLKASIQDPEVLRDLLWSRKTRKDMMESLNMTPAHFQMVLKKLRQAQFIVDGDINIRFIPHKTDDSRFMLAVYFNWSDAKHPIHGKEQAGRA